MEVFFILIILGLLIPTYCLSVILYSKHFRNSQKLDDFHTSLLHSIEKQVEKNEHLQKRIDAISHVIDRSTLALREHLETIKPIKPNNWDSVKKAFKGTTRVEEDE